MKPTKSTKSKTRKAEAQADELRHYYKIPVDSKTGRLLTKFWHACQNCEKSADDWCKKFGAKYYYDDPRYFAGGVGCVSFGDDQPDKNLWRSIGEIDGEQCYLPAVDAKREMVEIPSRDYHLQDCWDTMYLRDHIKEQTVKTDDGGERKALFVPKITFAATSYPGGGGRVITASRKARKAIVAEQHRLKLPVMTIQDLYRILGTVLPEGRLAEQTPTFFIHTSAYYVSCVYLCAADGLEEINKQTYRTHQCFVERQLARGES